MLLLSAYHIDSHQYWANQFTKMFPQTQTLTLPARYFSWRFQGNPLALKPLIEKSPNVTKVIATSMVNLAALKGICPTIGQAKSYLYFHENQFYFPDRIHEGHLERHLTSIYSALSAHRIAFNSEFNRSTFIEGCYGFLKKMPDFNCASIVTEIENKSSILPVPLNFYKNHRDPSSRIHSSRPLALLWNHRWEYDKGPETLLASLRAIKKLGIDFSIAIIGKSFRRAPPSFAVIRKEFANSISHWGFVENRLDYERIIELSDIVISTAHHDFQGLAIQEAINGGCLPVVPNHLAYPEYVPHHFTYPYSADPKTDGRSLAELIRRIWMDDLPRSRIDLTRFSLESLAPAYHNWISA